VIDESGFPSGFLQLTLERTEWVLNQRLEDAGPLDSGPALFNALQE
jgi:hypothetical protein